MNGYLSEEQKILTDRIQWFSAQFNLGLLATAINSTLLYSLLLHNVSFLRLNIWLVLTLLHCLLRFFLKTRNKNRLLAPELIHRVRNAHLILLALSGCLWGAVPVFLFPYHSMPHQLMVIFVLGGMVAGSVGIFASILRAYYFFSIPIVLPLVIVLFSIGGKMYLIMGCMILLFFFFMSVSARSINHQIKRFLATKYENINLIDNLEKEIKERETAEALLKKQNQEIESIVKSRTAELRTANRQLILEIEDGKKAKAALRDSEQRFREFANSLPEIVFELDTQGNLLFANENAYRLTGYTKEDFTTGGLNAFAILAEEDRPKAQERFQSVMVEKQLSLYEYTAQTKDGRRFPISIHPSPIFEKGQITGFRGLIIDLTEQKRLEKAQRLLDNRLQRADKMDLLGTIAGGVAHDLNNILSGIVSYPDLLLQKLASDSDIRKPIETIQRSGKKAAAIVEDLLTLTRRGVMAEAPVCLNTLVDTYLTSPEYKKLIATHSDICVGKTLLEPLPLLIGSELHLLKTLMNLVANSAEALPHGGKIDISTDWKTVDEPLLGYTTIATGEYVLLSVRDTGIGISPEDLEHIFEPFFTKKKMGSSGTGLGMTVVWGTVEDHKGYIDIESRKGKGTNITLYLPVSQKNSQETPATQKEPRTTALGNKEDILLVDDIEEVRQIGSEMIQHLGYTVHSVTSGEEALSFLKKQSVELVILDMIMEPGMDGLDTYREIIRLHPGQKTLITSGYSQTGRLKEALSLGAGSHIKKPYSLETLSNAIEIAMKEER